MTTETAARKDTQKLQRAIVDGLEDVKAQDIQVFNTEHLSPLFERVIVASGSSNRQTKALAASVRDAVRDAGFTKPRIEGEENGEWIIVDCGAAVAHIMQPAIRQYYHLEEIWGDKPVRIKFGAARPVAPILKQEVPATHLGRGHTATKKIASKSMPGRTKPAVKGKAKAPAAAKSAAHKAPAGTGAAHNSTARKAPARKTTARKTTARKTSASKTSARKAPLSKTGARRA